MACTNYSLKGMAQECGGSVAGLKKLYIGLASEWSVSADTGTTATTHSVTAITATTGTAKLYDYFIVDESSSLTSQLNVNNNSGTKYYTNTIAANFVKMTPAKHLELQALANEKLIIVAIDNNGQGWLIGGNDEGAAYATSETAQSGQAVDDLSGYSIEITNRSGHLPYGIDESLLEGKISVPQQQNG